MKSLNMQEVIDGYDDSLDLVTKKKLEGMERLLSYKPNNFKFLEFHKSNSKVRLLCGGRRCLPLDYKVLQSNGEWIEIDSLNIGDEILGVNLETLVATPTKVISKNYSGIKKVYKIELRDGTSFRASLDHLFPIYTKQGKVDGHGKPNKPKMKSVDYLIRALSNKEVIKRVLQAREIRFNSNGGLPLDPYLLGVLIGDGGLSQKSINFTNESPSIIGRVENILRDYNCILRKCTAIQYRIISKYSSGNPIANILRRLGLFPSLSGSKFIPKQYLTASVEDRKNLLAGLIDTDGTKNGFTSKSKQLAEDVCFLIRSLGGKATLFCGHKTCCNTGVTHLYWSVYWRLNFDLPLELKYKQGSSKINIDYSARSVKDFLYIGEQETLDLEIEHPDHTFVGENWVLTHNSGKSTSLIVEAVWAGLGIHPYLDYPPPPLKIRIVSVDFNSGKQIVLPLLYDWMPKHAISKFWAEDRILELTNGTTIDLKSNDQDIEKFEGVERHLVCVEGSQRIFLENGTWIPIKDTAVGDLIYCCRQHQNPNWGIGRITNKIDSGIKRVVKLKCSLGIELIATPDHKVLSNGGWKKIEDLRIGEKVVTAFPEVYGKKTIIVRSIEEVGDARVYDISVSPYSNFLVNGGLVVHNCIDEECRREVYESNYLRTISAGINGKIIMAMTPLHGMSWSYTDLVDNPEAVYPWVDKWTVSTYENPTLDSNAIDAISKDPVVKDNIEAAIYGRYFAHSGLVYPQFDVGKHVIQPVKEIPPDWMIIIGIDEGRRNPHGVSFCGLTPQNVWIVFDEINEYCVISELAAKIKAKLGNRFPPNLAIIDTSANETQSISGKSVSDELRQNYGLYTISAHKDINAGRLKIAELLDPGSNKKPELYVTQNCVNLIRQFRQYMWDEYSGRRKDKLDPKERPMKKNDHLVDSLRYAVMANIKYRGPEFSSYSPHREYRGKTGYY